MNDPRLGTVIRALRRRKNWRQRDLASAAGVSQPLISKLERGEIGDVNVDTVRAVTAALDATLSIDVRWHGGAIDRLLDEKHARIVGASADLLALCSWLTEVEVSYSVYGERGSIDILAWHEGARALLVIEVKSELVSVEATLRKLDEKTRLAGTVARERFGWRSESVARMLVLPSNSTERRRVARHDAALGAALPLRYDDLRAWLRRPIGPMSGILFVAD
ncbi:MAG: Helix-turn-helix domain, partial [Chloroflexota bacterium]|nr:Helix-turn-helix domain [Chloroflexota bacterium]